MTGTWPLVGRSGELGRLLHLLGSGDHRGVVVAGPAGVGKTRLATECLGAVEGAGSVTVRATATQAASVLPFGALAPLLPSAEGRGATEDRGEYLRRCCAAFAERAGGRRLVLLVDDAHLLDGSSAVLVHQLAVTGSAFVLATVRTGEPVPDAVRSLWKDGLAERVDLAGLPPDAVEELLRAVLRGPVDRAAVAALAARSQGNVLFLHELVLGSLASGALRAEGGLWRLVGPLCPSDRLVEIVEARLAGLSAVERSLVEFVALGEPVSGELGPLVDATVAESLERRSLLRSAMNGRRLEVRLAHPVYGEVIRARLPATRARRLARELAGAVEAVGARRREDGLRVAVWRLEDGEGARPDLMLRAAYAARLAWDLALAERLGEAALAAGAGFDAGLLLGQIASLGGRGEEAEARFAALAGVAGDDTRRAALAANRMDNLVWGLGRTQDAIRAAEAAEAAITDAALRDAVTAKRGAWLQVSGRTAEAVALLEPVFDRAEGPTLVVVCQHLAIPLFSSGRTRDALAVGARGAAAHQVLDGTPMAWGPYVHPALDCLALVNGGRLTEAEQRAAAGYERALAEGSQEAQGLFAGVFACALLARGRPARAEHLAREGVTLYREMGWRAMVRMALVPLVLALALLGRGDEAAGALAELDGLGLPEGDWPGPGLTRARAWAAVAAGDLPGARSLLEESAAVARARGDRAVEVDVLHDLVRLGRPAEVGGRLDELVAVVDSVLAPVQARHAGALAAGDGPALDEVSVALEDTGADLLAAEAAADAAVAFRRSGRLRSATAAEHRAATLAARCEGATTPALGAAGARARLTPAEREVALLAAAGRPNREIAAQLHLSVRTVENYLHRTYEKLGISGRAGLAGALDGPTGAVTS